MVLNLIEKSLLNMSDNFLSQIIEAIKLVAAPPIDQLDAFPDFVCKPDEIALTFDEVFSLIDDTTSISTEIYSKMKNINELFNTFRKEDWTEDAVKNSKNWQLVRQMAKDLLSMINIPYSKPNLFWISYIQKDKT